MSPILIENIALFLSIVILMAVLGFCSFLAGRFNPFIIWEINVFHSVNWLMNPGGNGFKVAQKVVAFSLIDLLLLFFNLNCIHLDCHLLFFVLRIVYCIFCVFAVYFSVGGLLRIKTTHRRLKQVLLQIDLAFFSVRKQVAMQWIKGFCDPSLLYFQC